jgi:hypothetical protein
MQIRPMKRWKRLVIRHRVTLRDGILLLTLMTAATFVAYQYDIFENGPGVATQGHVIELDEAVALVGLFCLGLLLCPGVCSCRNGGKWPGESKPSGGRAIWPFRIL